MMRNATSCPPDRTPQIGVTCSRSLDEHEAEVVLFVALVSHDVDHKALLAHGRVDVDPAGLHRRAGLVGVTAAPVEGTFSAQPAQYVLLT